jgi:enamine deaminase RidA (YjgF/YER057c/UK114 family)
MRFTFWCSWCLSGYSRCERRQDLTLPLLRESNNLLRLLLLWLSPMTFKLINPETLGPPRGYSNGVLTGVSGRLLFVAGQVGWDEDQRIVSENFVKQFDRALANVIAVVTEADGRPDQIARLVLYVTDKKEYQLHLKDVGQSYRAHMGKHFPAMVLVEVKGLLDDKAKVEIEAGAVLNP